MNELPPRFKNLFDWHRFFAALIGLGIGAVATFAFVRNAARSAVLDDPKFLALLAEKVRPVCLLGSNGIFYEDYGGLAFLARNPKFEISNSRETMTLTLRATQFLRQPPMITSLDGSLYLIESSREDTDTWRYRFGAVVTRMDASMGYHELIETNRMYQFRVEVLH